MLTDKVDSLYNALSDKIDGLGTLDEFRSRMQNPDNQRKFYDFVSNHYDIGTFEDYSAAINSDAPAAPKAEVRQDVIDTAKEAAPADITPADNSSLSYDSIRLLEEERDKLRKVDAEKVAKVNSAASAGGSYSFMPAAAVNMSQKAVKQEVYDKNERLKELDRMISEAYAPIYKQAAAEAKDAAAEALKMRQEISDVQAAELAKAAKAKGVQYSPQGMTMAAQYQAALNPRLQQRESMLQVAADYYRKAAEEYEKPTRFDDTNGFANVGRGALNTVIDRDFFSRGWTEFARASATKPLFDKISQIYKDAEAQQWNEAQISAEVSRQFTPEELRALGGFMSFMDAQGRRAQNGDISLGYQIGQTVGESAGYMLDFAIGNKMFGNAISESVSSVIGRSLPNAAKGTFKHTLNTTVRWAAGASAKTVPLTAVLGSTYANIAEKTLEINPATGNPYTWGEAFCEGLTESYIENFSESSGVAMTGLIKRGLALPLKSKGVRALVAKIGNEMTRKGLNPKSFRIADSVFGKQLAKELTDMGYNGIAEEWLEELFNAMSMEALGQITGKEAWKGQLTEDFFTKDNQAILWASFAVPGAVPGAARLAHIAKEHRRYREVKSQIADLFGDKDFAEQEANKVYNLARSSVAVQDENGKTHTKIQRVRLENGTECYIVGGKIAVDENGKVDINGSDATVYVRNVETDDAGVENISDEVTPVSINSNGQRITDVLLNEDYNAVSNNLLQTDYNEYHARRKYPIGDEVIIWRQNDAGELEPTVNEDGSIAYGRVTGFENGNVIIDPLTGEDNVGIPFADAEQMLTSRTEYENIQQQQQESEENVIEMDAEQQEDKPLGVFDAGSGVQITVRSAVTLADGKRYYMVSIQSPNSEAREGLTTEKDLALSIGAKNAYNVRQEAERRQSAQAEAAVENTAEAASNATGVIEDTNSPEQTETSEKPAETSEEPAKSEAETEYNRLTTEYGGAEMADTMIANTVANIQKSLDKKQKEYEKAQAELVELGLPFDEESKKKIEKAKQKVADLKSAVDTYNGQLNRFKTLQEYADKARQQAAPADNTEGGAEASEKGNAENNIEASVESGTDTSVPDMALDKASDARKRGYRMFMGKRYDRQGRLEGVKGKEVVVSFSNDPKDDVKCIYMAIEADVLQPSHLPRYGGRNPLFFLNEGQPKDRTDTVSVQEVEKVAANIDVDKILTESPVAYVGPSVVNMRGDIVQGHNRGNFVKVAYSNYKQSAERYKQALIERAERFGLDAKAVSAMRQPVLVRVADVSDEEAIRLGQKNDLDITTGGVRRINPVNVAKLLGDKIERFAGILMTGSGDEETDATRRIRDVVRSNANEAIRYLSAVGAITPAQTQSMYGNSSSVPADTIDDLLGVLTALIFKDGNERLPAIYDNILPAAAQKAILATAYRDLKSREEDRIIADIQEAMLLYDDMVRQGAFNGTGSDKDKVKKAVFMYRYQPQIKENGNFVPDEFFSNFAFELAVRFKAETAKQLKSFFDALYDMIQGTANDLFSGASKPISKAEAFEKLSRYDTRRTERENQTGPANTGQEDVSTLESGNDAGEQGGRGSDREAPRAEQDKGGVRPADSAGGDSPAGEQKQVKKPARKTSKKKEAGASAENADNTVESIFSDPSLQDDINELSELLERLSGSKYVVPNQDEASKRNSRIEDTLQLLNVGTRITAKVFQLGITRFARYAEVMIAKFGSSIKPFLKNIYKNSTALLQGMGLEFDSNEYVDGFNIDSLKAPKAEKVKSWSEFIDENLQGSEEITTLADEDKAFNKAQVEWAKANLETITEAYLSTHGNLLDPDEIREAFRPLGYDRTNVEKYRVAEKFLVEQIFKRMLSDANKAGNHKITFLTGVGGSGKSTATRQIKDFGKDSAIVYDSALNKYEKLKALIDQAVEAGVDDVHVLMVHNDAKTAFSNTLNRGLKTNRWLSLDYFIDAFINNRGKVKSLTDNYKNIDVIFYDNSGNNGRFVELEDALKWDYSLPEEQIQQLESLVDDNEQLTEQQKNRLAEEWKKKRLSEVSGEEGGVRKDDSRGEGGLRRPTGERDNVPLIENEAESEAETDRTIGTVSKSKHTKTGEDLFIVVPTARVSNEDFKQLKARAKAHNGYYSSYSKNRGFIFKSEEDAKQFNNISDDELTTDKVSADTQTIETEAGAIISEAEATGGNRRDSGAAEGEPGTESTEGGLPESGNVAMSDKEADKEVSVRQQVLDKIDKHIDKVNGQLAILGYYEAEEDPRMFNESYGYQKTAEQKALKDIERLAKQLADDLGLEVGKRKKLASANIAPAGGEISFSLPLADGKELHLVINLSPNFDGYFKEGGTRDDLAADSMYWRVEDPAESGTSRYLTHNVNYGRYIGESGSKILSVTYSQLLGDIQRIAKNYLPKKDNSDLVGMIGEVAQKERQRKKSDKKRIPANEPMMLDLFSGAIEDLNTAAQQEAAHETKDDAHHGYKVGDKVIYRSKGSSKREPEVVEIVDFNYDGRPVLDSFHANWISEIANWEDIEPYNSNDNGNTNNGTAEAGGTATEEPADMGGNGVKSDGRQQAGAAKDVSGEGDTGRAADADARETERDATLPDESRPVSNRGKRGGSTRTAGGVHAGAVSVKDPTVEHGDRRTDDGSLRTPKEKDTPKNTRNYLYPENAEEMDNLSPSERLKANVEALEVLLTLLKEGREATVEERAILGKLRGWGGINVPDEYTARYRQATLSPLQKRLVGIIEALDPSGERKLLKSLRTASLTSYYTPIAVARAMHAIAEQAGYKGKGNMLDPSMGNGVFEGSMPKGMQQSTNIRGVELDWLTGQIAKYLYPDARINITGFQDAHIPQDYFDYVISNIPFGNLQITDLDWKKNPSPIRKAAQGKIHNYFAVKMIESTRPGGLCVIMTSNAIMDTQGNNIIRKYIDDNCEVLGAVRLPNNTFKGAGTRAVTDIIYLRKFRDAADREAVQNNMVYMTDIRTPFLSLSEKELKDSKGVSHNVKYNDYYHKHPENIIGTPVAGGQYSDEAYDQESDLSTDELAQQLEKIGRSMMDERKKYLGSIITDTTIPREEIKERIKERYKGNGHYEGAGNIVVQDGKIGKLEGVKEGNVTQLMFNEQKFSSASVEQVTDYTKLRSLLKQLIHAQIENYDSEHIDDVRKQMQQAYTAYTKKYGKLGDKKNNFINEDIDGYQVRALEKWKDGKFVGMADIYTKNTIASERDIADTKDPQTAVLNSLAEYGSVNAEYLQSVLGDNFAEACKGLIFEDPSHQGEYIARDVYLSGDVVTKLEYARQIAKEDSRFQENVTALEAVQPKRKEFGEFPCHMGARWVPVQVYNDFLNDVFGIHSGWKGQKTGISYIEATDEYIFNFVSSEFGGKASKYTTSKKSAADIFKAALLDKDITVKRKDNNGKEYTDQEATDAARDKVAELREAFEDWLPLNPERVQLLTDTYNSVFNRHILPTYNGQHLNVVGLQGMKLRPHQKDAVWRIINQRGGIIDHIVGAGKSLVMQAAIMEMRRMGIAKKPMILALKSTTQQIADEFRQAFPAARILAPSEDDFSTKNRKRFLAQIAVNDYDCIILSHEQYEGLDHTDSVKRSFIEDQIEQLDNLLEYLYGQNDKSQLTTKQIKGLETRKENLKEKLKALDLMRTDEEFIFENLGVDYLFVDECQAFKNLMFQTSYKNIAGLGNPAGSERSTKLLYGVRSLQEMHQGDMGTVFLSGTTISNSLSELYNIFNYLRPNEMARMGLNTFDAWASTFAVRSTEAEFGATNELKEKNRFRKFEGVEELSRLYTEIADVRNDHNLELPKPKLHTVFVSIPISDTMKKINDAITALAKNHDGSFFGINPVRADKYPWSLQATNFAKMATLSPKLIDPSYDDENGKIFHVCENIKKIYDKFNEQKGTQLVFCDAGVPGPEKKYDAYTDIINRLTKDYGIPRSEIVDIHEANTDEKRKELFKKVNEGKVRILIGGTKNMGTGVNVQQRVVAMHHLDIPWTPADVDQRNGRGSRQGNEVARDYNNNQVDAYYYAVERTLDTYRYQLQEVKGKAFGSFKMANVGVSEFDEGGGDDNISLTEMVAILSGNPVILDKAKQDKLVDRLKRLQKSSVAEYSRRKSDFELQKQRKSAMEGLIRRNADDIEMLRRGGFAPDEDGKYPTTVYVSVKDDYASRRSFDKPKEAGEYIHLLLKQGKKVQLSGFKHIANITIPVTDAGVFSKPVAELDNYGGIKYTVEISDDDTAAGVAFRNLLQKVYSNADVYKRSLEEINNKLQGADPGEYSFPRQAELDEALVKKREIDEEYNKLVASDNKPGKSEESPEAQYDELDYDARNLTDAQQVATDALVDALRDNTGIDVAIATEEEIASVTQVSNTDEDVKEFSIRQSPAPKHTGIGYKVFYRAKDGKLYPPMVANPNGADTPVGVWLDADAAPITGESKTGRPQVKAGGKGTQGGSGSLAYRPGWHLGEIPYALQFNRKDTEGNKTLFPKDFVWAEVEYSADVDYQNEADKEGITENGKYRHSYAGLKHLPTNGFYRYRTNPNPATDPWIITGAMKVNRVLSNDEVDEIVRKAAREPQQREMLYTPQGKLYGWAEGNRIFLTPDGLNPNTPIHEYSHLWVKAVRRNNPELYKNLQDLFSRENLPEIWEKLDNDSNYAHLSEEGKLSEVISRFSGEHGAERMEAEAQKTAGDAKSLRERMKNLLREFWNWVGEHLFNIHNFGSREEAADRILYDLLNGTDLQLDTNTPDAADVEFEAWEDRMFSVQSVPQIDKIEDFTHYVDELRKYEEDLQAEFGRIRREYQQSVIKNANIFRRLYNKIADYYRPIEHFTRFLRSHGGTLSLSDDPYYDKFLTRGRITTARSNFDKNEWKNLKDALSVLALQGGIKGIAAGIILRGRDANDAYIKMQCTPYDVISLYLQAKDMKEVADMKGVDRGAVGFEEVTGINVETFINMVESSVDPDYIKDLWKKVKACTSFSLKYQHEHGYISKDTLNEYSKREYYVPQRGWRMRALSSYETGYVPDFNNDGSRPYNKALKKAKGRSSLADDPIAYIYSIAMSSIVETEKNISKQKLLKAVRDNINLAEATEGFGFRKVYYVNTGEKDDNGMPIFERTYDKPKKEWIENDKQIRKEIADVEGDINDEATNLRLNPNLPTATFDALIQKRASLLASLKVAYRAGTNMGVKSMLSNEEKKQHVVRVIENGEEVEVWFTDERLANAMNDNFVYSQSSDVFSSIYNGLSRITRYMSAILTQYNPIWATWNYLRDFGTMFFSNIVTGDKEYLVPASKLAIGVIPSIARYLYHRDFNSKYGTYLQEFFNEGAETGFSFLSNIDEIGQAIKADVSLNGGGKVRKATEKLLGGLSFLTEMSELSIRLAQFIAMREAGKSATEAAIGAKEISVNFDRKSDLSRMLSPLFSFFNATIQGTNKFYRAIENNSVAKMRLTATGALFFLGGMINALLAPDDPDEERAWSDYDRMTNILLGPVRIPLPHFLRTFWACGAQTALMMSGQKPIKEGMIDAVHFVLDDILPTQVNLTQLIQYENTTGKAVVSVEDYIQSMSPTTISPIVDIILNRDFMGRKIYKVPYVENQRGKIPQTQLAYRNTNPALQAFTDWLANVSGGSSVAKTNRDIPYLLDVNPGKMQHVISGYSPAIAETLVKFAGVVSDLVSGEGFDVSNIPFLSRAIKPYRAERLQKSLYWEIKGIVDRYEGDYKAYKKSPEKRDKATAKQMMSKDNRRLIRRARKILRTCDPDRRNATKEEIREMYEIKKEVIDAFID